MAFVEPFDFYTWWVNTFAGDMQIFLAICFIFLAGLAGYFRMAPLAFGMLFALFVIILAPFVGGAFILVVIVVGLIMGWWIARTFR